MSVPTGVFLEQLQAAGFEDATALAKADFFSQCDAALDAAGAKAARRVSVWVPGRIELFGKHTDYAGGRSLLAAMDRGFCVRAAPRDDQLIRMRGCDPLAAVPHSASPLMCEVPLAEHVRGVEGHFSHYVATVARRVAVNFPSARTGLDIAFVSDLPQAAGASSSTALMISVFLAIVAVNRLDETPEWKASLETREDLAGYLGAMEMGGPYRTLAGVDGVGTLGGSQDQTAILCAEPQQIVDFSWMPVRRRAASSLPRTHCFVIAASGIAAEKSSSAREKYNRVSLMVRHLLACWNTATERTDASLGAAIESAPSAPDAFRELIPSMATPDFSAAALRARLDQFLLETYTLIPEAVQALVARDWPAFGEIALRSQRAAERGLANQIPETSRLVTLAREQGAIAASAFGAGFGGSVWALVPAANVAPFTNRWATAYRGEFPVAGAAAMFFATAAGPPAMQWTDDARAG